MASAADDHMDHSLGTRGSGGRVIMEEIPRCGDRWSVTEWPPTDQFQDKRGTRGSGGRIIMEEIPRYGDRWPPTDQFQDEHPGENARSNRAPISHRVHGHRGFVLHAVKLGLRFPARALRMDLA